MLQFNLNDLIEPIVFTNTKNNLQLDVLHLEKIDDQISGNKWFKLKYHLEECRTLNAYSIITFGGIWSNHIAATSAACKEYKIKCKAIVRSDEKLMTTTLLNAKNNGTEIEFVDRLFYKNNKLKTGLVDNIYYIPEGGATKLGINGAKEILDIYNLEKYTHLICPIGTGTTFAGIVKGSTSHQKVIGINSLKGGFFQENDLKEFISNSNYEVFNNYHFGGFAKCNTELISFMNFIYKTYNLKTDFIYTAKMFYAIFDLIKNNYFIENSKILAIHTGGLQGNKSFKNEILFF